MLTLRRLELEGFGPFATRQVLEFPAEPGVTVIYGENMRGKTFLLNAIRYAFFSTVLARGARPRRMHQLINRDMAAEGRHEFSVILEFDHDGSDYELMRRCRSVVSAPTNDGDYAQEYLLRRGVNILGPQERDRALQTIFPDEISRFFLFDGELLQEYEQLLLADSAEGQKISEAIERILGLPILKRGRKHLTRLAELADEQSAREAQKDQSTKQAGVALQQAKEQRDSQRDELSRLQKELDGLISSRAEIEEVLKSQQRLATIIADRDRAESRIEEVQKQIADRRADLKLAMSDAWRSVLCDQVRSLKKAAQETLAQQVDSLALQVRRIALQSGECPACQTKLSDDQMARLNQSLELSNQNDVSAALRIASGLASFQDSDNSREIRQLSSQLKNLERERLELSEKCKDLTQALGDADQAELRDAHTSYSAVIEQITIVKGGIEKQQSKVNEAEQNIQRLKKKLESASAPNLRAAQLRATTLREASAVFSAAIDRYKAALRGRVEETASKFFLGMTTEREDYAALTINENYGLTIRHRDGRPEDARSAGAEHVVALALMGALQNNAPLRGPIVMDSPFGRLDEAHSANVVRTLPKMAQQVVLLVYESEVGRDQMRNLLGSNLVREYQLERISSRRTNIVEVR